MELNSRSAAVSVIFNYYVVTMCGGSGGSGVGGGSGNGGGDGVGGGSGDDGVGGGDGGGECVVTW